MHSSGMCTTLLLTVSQHELHSGAHAGGKYDSNKSFKKNKISRLTALFTKLPATWLLAVPCRTKKMPIVCEWENVRAFPLAAENCIKIKKIGLRGGIHPSWQHPRSAMALEGVFLKPQIEIEIPISD